jgi:hypothetical protein
VSDLPRLYAAQEVEEIGYAASVIEGAVRLRAGASLRLMFGEQNRHVQLDGQSCLGARAASIDTSLG